MRADKHKACSAVAAAGLEFAEAVRKLQGGDTISRKDLLSLCDRCARLADMVEQG